MQRVKKFLKESTPQERHYLMHLLTIIKNIEIFDTLNPMSTEEFKNHFHINIHLLDIGFFKLGYFDFNLDFISQLEIELDKLIIEKNNKKE